MANDIWQETNVTAKPVWRKNQLRNDNVDAYILASGNGTSYFGRVKAGTIMGLLANGKIRPCVFQEAAAAGTATNDVEVGDADNVYVGDVVSLVKGTTPATVIVAGDNPSNLTITPRVGGVSVNIVSGTVPSALTHSYDEQTGEITINAAVSADAVVIAAGDNPSNLTITPRQAFTLVVTNASASELSASLVGTTLTINLDNDGGGAVETTVGELAALLETFNDFVDTAVAETPADLAQAVTSTAITYANAGGGTTTTVGDIADILVGSYSGLITSAVAETPADLCVDVGPTALPRLGDVTASARTVTAVDKDTNVVTVNGGSFNVGEDDILRLDDGWEPVGVLNDEVDTIEFRNGAVVEYNRDVTVGVEGNALDGKLVGLGNHIRAFMLGGYFTLAVQPDTIVSRFAGMRTHSS